ncbi:MAG: carboxypeptidase regulatory-like domain-containing protein, partial [Pyrinomonadaceae bacterium]
ANVSIAAGQTGTLVNTATVTAPPTVIDPNLTNNTSTDTDTYGMSISGNVQQFVQGGPNTNLAGVLITAQPGGATATTNGSGNYSIAGVPGTTYTLTPTMAGKVFDPTSRVVTSTANVTGVNFIAYNTNAIPRNIFVVNGYATPGNPVTVPIRMTAQGGEKTMAFSIDYPLTSLFTPVVTCGASTAGCTVASTNVTPGKLGISITAAGAGVAAGLREIANVTFQTNIGFAPPNAPLTFSTTPTAQSVRDAASNELQKTFTDGFVVFVDGVESDVAGRNSGNGDVASTDVVQVRRFVANLDVANPAFNEFQRADGAPFTTKGDGELLPGDVVQARRYAARLDALQAAAGPAGAPPPPLGPIANPGGGIEEEANERAATDREFSLTTERADRGQRVGLGVEYSPKGDESAVSFTIEYNAARLANAKIELGEGMPEGTVLTVNENDAAMGRIGVLIDSATPLGTSSNIKRLITITFDVTASAPGGETRVRLTRSLVPQGVSDAEGNTLKARYNDGGVIISGPESTGTELSGRVTMPDGRGVRGAQVTILDATGRARTVTTGTFGYYRFDDVAPGETYTVGINSARYTFTTKTVTTDSTLATVDFIAQD